MYTHTFGVICSASQPSDIQSRQTNPSDCSNYAAFFLVAQTTGAKLAKHIQEAHPIVTTDDIKITHQLAGSASRSQRPWWSSSERQSTWSAD